jgi:hypothetical protein
VYGKEFGQSARISVNLAVLFTFIIFYQASALEEVPQREGASREDAGYALSISAIDAANLLQWTVNPGQKTVPFLPGPSLAAIDNNPPGAPATPEGPSSGIPAEPYAFAASATDPDGDRIRYIFDWGDGKQSKTGLLLSGEKAIANHTWARAGIYRITVIAEDVRGAPSAWSLEKEVIINTPPDRPTEPSGPGSIYAWVENAYSSSATDPDGDPVEYAFDWGDGNVSRTGPTGSGNNASVAHIWAQAGAYRVRVIARDPLGAESNWSEDIIVSVIANNRPESPKELFGPVFGYRAIANSYFTMARDTDDDRVVYCLDWGDGASSTTELAGSGSIECASHAWSKAGEYLIRARATDMKGASSGWMELMNVTIADNDPPDSPALPSGPTSGTNKASYRYATSANDPDGDHVKYVFDWGDKTTSWTGLDYIDSGTKESVSHKWSRAGTYQVKAMALDDKGATSGWSGSLTINISPD